MKKNAEWIQLFYSPDHIKYEGFTVEGKPFGAGRTYYMNGAIYQEGVFDVKGLVYGREYYPSGVLRFEGAYRINKGYGPNYPVYGKCDARGLREGDLAVLRRSDQYGAEHRDLQLVPHRRPCCAVGSLVGLLLGITAALNRGKFLDGFCTVFSILGVCVPSYVFLIFLQYTFSFRIPFFPYFFDDKRFLFSSVIPALSLSVFAISTIARFTRNERVEGFDSDYVRLAESKGMYGRNLVMKHVLRNALIPIVTVLAPLIVDLLTGALVVEKIYGINGIGKLMVDAIAGEGIDYNYVLALGILYSALYIGIMLVVDLLYGVLDPRIRVSAKGKEA